MSVDVSVIVPTHDRRSLLQRKLEALEGQDGSFEVIVVADACTDDTEEFLAAYRPPYPFSWLTGPGLHAATARNLGAERAKGRVLLFSDDDAVPTPGWVLENARLHDRPGRVGLSRQLLPAHLAAGATLERVSGWRNCNGCSVSLEARLFREVGGYDPRFSAYGGEDLDLGWRLKGAGARFEILRGAPVEHWDERYGEEREVKARSAGAAHVRVWRKHRSARVGFALGVHPVLLFLKRLFLNPVSRLLIGSDTYEWETAYADGAREELRRVSERHG